MTHEVNSCGKEETLVFCLRFFFSSSSCVWITRLSWYLVIYILEWMKKYGNICWITELQKCYRSMHAHTHRYEKKHTHTHQIQKYQRKSYALRLCYVLPFLFCCLSIFRSKFCVSPSKAFFLLVITMSITNANNWSRHRVLNGDCQIFKASIDWQAKRATIVQWFRIWSILNKQNHRHPKLIVKHKTLKMKKKKHTHTYA